MTDRKILGGIVMGLAFGFVMTAANAQNQGCLSCHEGIERFSDGAMQETIELMGVDLGDPGGCVVCHGGDPAATTAEAAHDGAPAELVEAGGPQMFYPDPGSVWIADNTCGQCHDGYADRLTKSLMNTEAGKLQGNLWSWGLQSDYKTVWGNYDLIDEDGAEPAVGSPDYIAYMTEMVAAHPDQFPSEMKQISDVDVDQIPEHPNLAGITYSRQQCQRCHVGVTGREKRGDFRGTGCSSCHVPYSNEGRYEGGDPTIDKDVPGKLLVHKMQATRKSKVKVGDVEYSGIPAETCNTCHNRGKRIGVSYQGIMEFPYGSPYDEKGEKQPKLHTKNYQFIKDDLHHQIESRPGNPKGGLLCQDCHTSIDMHGDGNLFGTTLAQVEIECQDCHGTTTELPWDLPLGHGEEFQEEISAEPRGLTDELPDFMYNATEYEAEDGYLLTARGNPFGNVVKRGKKVILHSASGLDFEVPVLKQIADDDTWKNQNSRVAMGAVGQHMESMECYACHADWAPQCYGCHITVDYSEGKTDIDWINNANSRAPNGLTEDNQLGTNGLTGPGKVSETRSYLRWETPILGMNGEGRVSPLMPGCQVITTVIDKEGNTVAHNETWMTPEGKGLDHAAVQPHTAGRKARSCESCHDNPKTLGYGIEDGRFLNGYESGFVVDLETALGETIPQHTQFQSQPVPSLDHDLSQIVTRDDEQLVSIGSHWPLTGPLPAAMRDKMERTGLCMGCHQNMENEDLWAKVNDPGWANNDKHKAVMDKLLRAYAKERDQ
ncbi:MAG: cytochrome C [Alphaproteobacteria bacterium]|nr:cytochrome C [Alphaproteobacteria bacterium]